jgi:hypothetical protein
MFHPTSHDNFANNSSRSSPPLWPCIFFTITPSRSSPPAPAMRSPGNGDDWGKGAAGRPSGGGEAPVSIVIGFKWGRGATAGVREQWEGGLS